MAGHMGDKNRTQQNLEIVSTDAERGLIFVKGSVPGSKGGWLLVKEAGGEVSDCWGRPLDFGRGRTLKGNDVSWLFA